MAYKLSSRKYTSNEKLQHWSMLLCFTAHVMQLTASQIQSAFNRFSDHTVQKYEKMLICGDSLHMNTCEIKWVLCTVDWRC